MKTSKTILSFYNLLLAIGAMYSGITMISGKLGEYPAEWINKLPFTNWIYPGIIVIILYSIGNFIAAGFNITKNNKGLIFSAIMGVVLLVTALLSIKILGEMYLATLEFIFFSIIQIALTLFAFIISSKNKIQEQF